MTPERSEVAPRRAYVLAVLFSVGVFNIMDRQILAILLEPIKRDLAASDTAMGLLTGFAFSILHALASLPIARLADTRSRRNIISLALGLWSLLTALSGMATSFAQLALLRLGVGAGEAATNPAAHSMLSDLFPPERRATALSFLAVSTPVGLMAAFMLGGWLNEWIGWRLTLMYLGLPGLLLAILVALTVAEPRRGGAESGPPDVARYELRSTLRHLWSLRSFRHLTLGASLSMFAGTAIIVWSPAFLMRVHGLTTAEAGLWLGLAAGIGGATGILSAGLLAQRLARRDPRWLLGVPAFANMLAAPFVLLFASLPHAGAVLPMLFGIMLFGPAMLGPVMTVTQGLAKVRMRAVAAAFVSLVFSFVGGLGPVAAGALSDLLAPHEGVGSVRYGLLLAGVALFGAGLHFALGARSVARDLESVAGRILTGAGAERRTPGQAP